MTLLEALIHEEIRAHGPISFRRFMDLALYHPVHGYYTRGEDHFGREGDFYTNSQLQPVFGRLISQQIVRWREEMGSPEDFTVVELGAGRGETLTEVRKALPEARCLAVERTGGTLPEAFQGVVYSNEFFDALPVHLVERRSEALIELLVASDDGGFQWTTGRPAEPSAANYISRYAPGFADGDRIEVNLDALDECERIAAALKRGYVLTIDYGYTSEEIAAGRRFPRGSLMAYERHQAEEDVLANPGRRDITAHVNFTALEARGRDFGLDSLGLRTQAQFLFALGETDNFAAALEAATDTEALHLRMQLKSLLFGMGETFRVLVQKK
ncbi:MAG: SAM-dependent methyltransferase [Bryobacterales bacterium]|nr:SAM-dependent methyltransferase [Bryobacterales bacterium]